MALQTCIVCWTEATCGISDLAQVDLLHSSLFSTPFEDSFHAVAAVASLPKFAWDRQRGGSRARVSALRAQVGSRPASGRGSGAARGSCWGQSSAVRYRFYGMPSTPPRWQHSPPRHHLSAPPPHLRGVTFQVFLLGQGPVLLWGFVQP